MRALERQRLGVGFLVRELEDHRAARVPGDHLPASLDARHAHHLRGLDVVVLRTEIVDELLVALLRLHERSMRYRETVCTTARLIGRRKRVGEEAHVSTVIEAMSVASVRICHAVARGEIA